VVIEKFGGSGRGVFYWRVVKIKKRLRLRDS